MKYEIIQPPFTLEFRTMSRREATEYYDWFLGQIPTRITVLERAVRSTVGYEDWQADDTPASLERLGQWFCDVVEVRKTSRQEKKDIYDHAPAWFRSVEIEDWELTNRTFSLARDIGMYLSQVLLSNVAGLEWMMVEKPKNDVDFQQPVLRGTGKLVLNPVGILEVYAYGIARHSKGPKGLRELYEIWAGLLKG